VKLQIYFRPGIAVSGLLAASAICTTGTLGFGRPWNWLLTGLALFYFALLSVAGYALLRCFMLEQWMSWDEPERLLILSPHQDDCVICAGGIGIRNRKLGGAVHVVYLVQDDKPGAAELRKAEAVAAWALAGVPASCLSHLDLLPSLYAHDPDRLRNASSALNRIIDKFGPTVIVMPMFEGGHVHHDLLNHLVSSMVHPRDGLRVFEAPEYSPFVSLRWTPHRVIALCVRWLFGLVAYYGPADGMDDRFVWKLRLAADELALKRRMLAAFASQNGASLAATRSYPDRLVMWRPRTYRPHPFHPDRSYLATVRSLGRVIPIKWALRLFPVQFGTVGREPEITNLDEELA
jgi:LmbE family N-acetylglucosaminyl deacetylase